jgi:hypothetical protein
VGTSVITLLFTLYPPPLYLSRLKNYGNIKLENSHCGNVMVEIIQFVISSLKLPQRQGDG